MFSDFQKKKKKNQNSESFISIMFTITNITLIINSRKKITFQTFIHAIAFYFYAQFSQL